MDTRALAAYRQQQARLAALPPVAAAPCSVTRPSIDHHASLLRNSQAADDLAAAAEARQIAAGIRAAWSAEARRPRRMV